MVDRKVSAISKQRHSTRYNINQCVFYKLRSRRKCAELLHITLPALNHLLKNSDNYRIFHIVSGSGAKPRLVEWPKPLLERVHRRLLVLLQRIETPMYLHSGVKGRSYITNAREHTGCVAVAKLDIKSFYQSTTAAHVYSYFRNVMMCSKDVAELITNLVTIHNHVPTGSCVSQQIAFLAHKVMFDELNDIAHRNAIKMTCYVDDISFSGKHIPGTFLYVIKRIIKIRGLSYHKQKTYTFQQPKLITGVVVSANGIRVRNRLHKAIHEGFNIVESMAHDEVSQEIINRLAGQINAASQIEPAFRGRRQRLAKASPK